MTVEGLQEWYDEACMVVYNNKVNHIIKIFSTKIF